MLGIPILTKIHPKFNTPLVSILFNAFLVGILTTFSFSSLVEVDVILYSLSLCIEYCALVWLRVKEPNLGKKERAFRIPLSTKWLGLFVTPPIFLCFLSIILTSLVTKIFGMIAIFIGILIYFGVRKFRNWKRSREANQNYNELREFFSDKVDDGDED